MNRVNMHETKTTLLGMVRNGEEDGGLSLPFNTYYICILIIRLK